jgi:hypothetical protein
MTVRCILFLSHVNSYHRLERLSHLHGIWRHRAGNFRLRKLSISFTSLHSVRPVVASACHASPAKFHKLYQRISRVKMGESDQISCAKTHRCSQRRRSFQTRRARLFRRSRFCLLWTGSLCWLLRDLWFGLGLRCRLRCLLRCLRHVRGNGSALEGKVSKGLLFQKKL